MTEHPQKPKRKPKPKQKRKAAPQTYRKFILAALALLFINGLVVAFALLSDRSSYPTSLDLTRTAIVGTNCTLEMRLVTSDAPDAINATCMAVFSASETAAVRFMPTLTPFPTFTPTPERQAEYMECSWQWATDSLPELSAQIQNVINGNGITGVTVEAAAYGENCIPSVEDATGYFAAMETDFGVTAQIADLNDAETMGNILADVLAVLADFPPENTPGPNPGRITFIFSTPQQERRQFTAYYTEAVEAVQNGLRGAELLDTLGGLPE